jgi:hypothetical protein
MNGLFDKLTPFIDHRGEPAYRDAEIRAAATHVIQLCDRDLLAVLEQHVQENHFAVSFVVFEFMMSNTDGTDVVYGRVFHGNGYSGTLRELRHSFWGEADNDGYIFYPSASLIGAAFKELERWFDCA